MENANRLKKLNSLVFYLTAFVIIPALIAVGVVFLDSKNYAIISVVIAFVCNIPFLIKYEKSKSTTREVVVVAVMTALTVVSRLIFAPIPAFKPVTALVIITGIAYGGQAGYITGVMSAVVSNIFFGQGPWTPFQMLVWGAIGFFAGVLFCDKKLRLWLVCIYSGICGGLFSIIMDIWTVLSIDNYFSFARYGAVLLASLPFLASYVVSNIVFNLILTKPFLKKMLRVKTKFGIFERK